MNKEINDNNGSKMLNMMVDYIRNRYFYVFLDENYEKEIIDHKNYFEIILFENNIGFKAIFNKQCMLLYCYFMMDKIIDCVDEDNFFIIDFKYGIINNVFHFKYSDYIFFVDNSVRNISDKLINYLEKDNFSIYKGIKNDLLGSSIKRDYILVKTKDNK